MIATAHKFGVPVLVDGAQSVPHFPVDVQDLDADFFVFSGHKMFGPTGSGVLYGKRKWLDQMPPYQTGGGMIRSVSFERTTFAPIPDKFEAGTPAIAAGIGLGAAIDYINSIDFEAAAAYEHELLEYATERLADIPGVTIVGTAANKASRSVVYDRERSSARHRHDSRPAGNRRPCRPSLCTAGDAIL